MRQDLHDDPAVIGISSRTGIDEDSVVGKLHRLWCWADKHTADGTAPGITPKWVDRYVYHTGFAEAMVAVAWLEFSDFGVIFPRFDRHNGESAKARADAAVRQRLSRQNRDNGVTGAARTAIPKPFVRHVLLRDAYVCVYCGRESTAEREASRKSILSIDHIIPSSRGGGATVDDLACCCKACNNEKNDRTPEEFGILPTFLQPGLRYESGKIVTNSSLEMSQTTCDKGVTREEKRREEVNLKPHSEERGEVNGTTAAQNPPPPPSRKGIVCGLLRKAGMADAAPHYLPDDAWETILAKRTDEEIIEVALAKMAAKPNGRIGLKYIAPALLADPEPITPSARGSPKSTWGKHADYLRQQGYIGDGNGNGNAGGTIDGEAKRVA